MNKLTDGITYEISLGAANIHGNHMCAFRFESLLHGASHLVVMTKEEAAALRNRLNEVIERL